MFLVASRLRQGCELWRAFRQLLLVLCLIPTLVTAQQPTAIFSPDTLRFATYNLLNYGNSANRPSVKNPRLSLILSYMTPDLIGFNEVSSALPDLQDSLAAAFPYEVQHGNMYNSNSATQMNALFWKSGKFTLVKDSALVSDLRDIVVYDLFYNDLSPGLFSDTIWLKVIVAHLKASNTSSDKNKRLLEAAVISNYLAELDEEANYVLMGDLNLYRSSEPAYQLLTQPESPHSRLNDPLDMPGNWDNNPAFSLIHTQSPRSVHLPDGGATGGLDSRFDFLLVSDAMLQGTRGIRYVPGSYRTVGNDGLHFDRSILDSPVNMIVPPDVLEALYYHSDHLPVTARFIFRPAQDLSVAQAEKYPVQWPVHVQNPFRSESVTLSWQGKEPTAYTYHLTDATGRLLQSGSLHTGEHQLVLGQAMVPGLYLLTLTDSSGRRYTYKLSRL